MPDLLDERMDQRLTRAARRWQGELPQPPAIPVDRLDEALPEGAGRRGALAAVAAAAVVLAGGIGIGAVRAGAGDSSTPSDHPSPTPTVHSVPVSQEVVPWRKLKAQHPSIGHRVHGKLVTAYDGLFATGKIGGTLHPGDTLVFTVTLHSSSGIVLHPCPDYSIAFGRKAYVTRQLNCAQVPFTASHLLHNGQMSDFWPTLPANTPVSFRMRMKVPEERGKQKVLWTLDGPQQSPGFYGIVRVTPG